jgi:phage gp36-like protein
MPTVDDMIAHCGRDELMQVAGTGPRDMRTLDTVRIATALTRAASTVVGYVRGRYPTITADTLTPMLTGYALDLARHELRLMIGPSAAIAAEVKERADAAIARLKDISNGRLSLDVEPGTTTPAAPASELTVTAVMPAPRTSTTLAGYRP